MLKKINPNFVILVIVLGSITVLIFRLVRAESPGEVNRQKDVFYLASPSMPPKSFVYQIRKCSDTSVLKRGFAESWDSEDVLNPDIIKKGDTYINYYSGYSNGVWSTGYAESKDGLVWKKRDSKVLTVDDCKWTTKYIAANGSSVIHGDDVYLYFQGTNDTCTAAVGLGISHDGISFDCYDMPVLSPSGVDGEWDCKAVADPFVFKHNDKFYLYYLGQSNVDVQKLGVAVSVDGIHWKKHVNNPIMDVGAMGSFDENGLGEPAVFFEAPYFYMIYTGRNASEQRNLGLAISSDGINWRKMNHKGILDSTFLDNWNSQVVCDPEPVMIDDQLYVYFGGGNNPSPDQGLNGEIGMFVLELPSSWSSSSFDCNSDWTQSEVETTDILKGSFPVEEAENSKYVWIEKKASISLKQEKGMNSLFLNAYLPFDQIKKSNPDVAEVVLSIKIDGTSVYETKFDKNETITLDIPVSVNDTGKKRFVEIELSEDFQPENDKRNLALLLNSIGFGIGAKNTNQFHALTSNFDCNANTPVDFQGLFAIEGEEGGKYAWSSKDNSIQFLREEGNSSFVFEGYIPYNNYGLVDGSEVTLEIEIDGKPFFSKIYKAEESVSLNIPIDKIEVGEHKIEMYVNADFRPENDERNLSFVLKKVGFY